MSYPIGTKLKIINAGTGALGCNGSIGIVTSKSSYNGLSSDTVGYNIEITAEGTDTYYVQVGQVWRIHPDAEVEVLELSTNYWENVCDIQRKQTAKGIETYGQTLEQNTDLDPIQRLTYLEEELIDGLMYIEHIKAGIMEGKYGTISNEA